MKRFICIAQNFICGCMLLGAVACQESGNLPDKPVTTVADALTGTWVAQSWHVIVFGKDGSAVNDTLIAEAEDFPKMLNLKTHIGYFDENGSYLKETIGLDGKVLARSSGTWETTGDTVVIRQDYPEAAVLKYRYSFDTDQLMVLQGMIDFDGDGKEDDMIADRSLRIE